MFPFGSSTGEDAHPPIHSHVLWLLFSCTTDDYDPKKQYNQNGLAQPQVLLGANIQRDYDSTIYLMDLSLCEYSNCSSQVTT